MIKAKQRFKVFYQKLFVAYWCAARRYQDEAMSAFYGVMLVSLNWMLLGGFLWFSGVEVVQYASSRTFDLRINWMIVIGGCATLGNLIFFLGRSRWRVIVEKYADLGGHNRYIPHMKKRIAYLIPAVLWVLTTAVAFM